jgi:hypothetical protein
MSESEIEELKRVLKHWQDMAQKYAEQVTHWKEAYHRVKTENEKLSLDLGIKNKDFI